MIGADIDKLQTELKRGVEDIRQLRLKKETARSGIRDLESKIEKLKKNGAVSKQIWVFENKLAELVRERNALANAMERARARMQNRADAIKQTERRSQSAMAAEKRVRRLK